MPTETTRTATSISEWRTGPAPAAPTVEEGFVVDLPSGNRVLMKRDLSMPTMLATGQIPNPLGGIVRGMIDAGKSNFTANDIKKFETDPRIALQMLDMIHETIIRCVIEPEFDMPVAKGKLLGPNGKRIEEEPEEYMERLAKWRPALSAVGKIQHDRAGHTEEDDCDCERKISVWSMYEDDRYFIFSVAQGAAADLATFREEQDSAVADLQAGEGVRKPTKRTGGNRSKK